MSRPMKDSGVEWIGEIPESWILTKVKRLGSYTNGYAFKPDTWKSEGKPIIRIQNLSNPNASFNRYDGDLAEKYLVQNGDFLISWSATLDVFRWNGEEAYLNQHIFKAVPKEETIDREFFYWSSKMFMSEMANDKHGSAMQHVTKPIFDNFIVPIPTKREQRVIANILTNKSQNIDIIIANTKQSIVELKKYKQSLITETVTKGLNPDVKMKNSGVEWVGEIPEHWVCSKIKYITSLSRGQFSHRPRNDERFYDGAYPFIQTGDVAKANKFITSYSQTLNELGKGVSKEFPKGTLVMTIAANVGDVAVLGFDSYFPDSIIGFVPNTGYYWNYLYYLFSAMKPTFVNTAIVSTQLNLNIERVKEISIPTTINSEEQQQIADFLDEKCAHIDSLIADKEKLIGEFEDYKKALIYEYVTGKKEVE